MRVTAFARTICRCRAAGSLAAERMAPRKSGHTPRTSKTRQTYADGRPFDHIQYFQGKILLKPERFSSIERFQDLASLARRTAKSSDIDFIEDASAGQRPCVREIIFGDTPDFRLYNNGFILRRRTQYVDGFPVGDPEIVFKFRHARWLKAAALDVRPRISGHFRIKFKEQVLPQNDRIGSYRMLYSHNCQFGISQTHEVDRFAMSTLTRVFPPLNALKHSKQERLSIVNEGIIEELLLRLGALDFGKGIVAKSSVSLWRTRGDHLPLVGEYSFQVKFDRRDDIPRRAKDRVKRFFLTLQRDARDWIALGTTKTGLVYRLKGNALRRHE